MIYNKKYRTENSDKQHRWSVDQYFFYTVSLFFLLITGCKKFVDIPPPSTQLVAQSVYATNATASAAVTGIYGTMISNSIGGDQNGISALLGLSSDEFKLYPTITANVNEAYANSLLSTLNIPYWSDFYNSIYQANLAIENISTSSNVTPSMKQQLLGEAKFIRAFCYMYLENIFGDVPLITSTNYKINALIQRDPRTSIYNQIESDLKAAQISLSDDYLGPDGTISTDRVRPNKGAATALLSRVYLYQQKWDSAEIEATKLLSNSNYQLQSDLNSVFIAANNNEAIWQLESQNSGFNTPDGFAFLSGYLENSVPRAAAPFLLSDSLVNNFELGDLRKISWVVSETVDTTVYYFPYKYKLGYTGQPPTEYPVLLRLAEQFLIRAEARAQQGNLDGAKSDLNVIRNRAGLANTLASSQSEVIAAIMNERRFELFTEYGHRWFDLKRTNSISTVMGTTTPLKGGTWEPTDQLYPIPIVEIQRDPNLTQNSGYQ
jgi:hypothetical protein